jgi:outer membrane receptor protein involved in Fe transport
VAADTDSTFKGDELLATLNITHDFGDYQLTSLTGYGEGSSEANTDYDNADLPFRFLVPITYTFAEGQTVTTDRLLTTDSFRGKGRTWTQEVRLTSDRGGMFDFTVGGFYLNSRSSAAFIIWHPSLELAAKAFGLPPESRIFINETPRATTESWALFGETYFRLSERTRITLGGRYTWDDKSIQTRSILLAPPPPFIEASRSWQRFTGRVAIDHRLSDDSLVYASFAHGYKGGGLNPGNSGTPDFDPETVNAIEFGSKNRFLNGTLSANFAGFWYDYKGLQLAQRTGTQAVTSNADARVWGLEAEMVAAPARGLTFDLNLAYLNTRIRDFVTVDAGNPAQVDPRFQPPARTPVVAINLDGNRLPYAPDFKIQLGAQYVFDLGSSGWRATLRSDYVLQDEYYAREFNTVNDRIESWSVLNAFVRLDAPDRRFTLEGWVKNITDADNITNSIIEDATVGSYRNVRVLEPRTFGISGTFRF